MAEEEMNKKVEVFAPLKIQLLFDRTFIIFHFHRVMEKSKKYVELAARAQNVMTKYSNGTWRCSNEVNEFMHLLIFQSQQLSSLRCNLNHQSWREGSGLLSMKRLNFHSNLARFSQFRSKSISDLKQEKPRMRCNIDETRLEFSFRTFKLLSPLETCRFRGFSLIICVWWARARYREARRVFRL